MRGCALAFALALCACASSPAPPQPDLIGTQWMRVDDEEASPHYSTLEFGAGAAKGFIPGCNAWSAAVKRDGAALSFSRVQPMRLDCEANSAVSAAGRSLMCALAATRAVQLSGNALILLDARGAQVARFEPN